VAPIQGMGTRLRNQRQRHWRTGSADALCRQLNASYTFLGPGTIFTMTFK